MKNNKETSNDLLLIMRRLRRQAKKATWENRGLIFDLADRVAIVAEILSHTTSI